MDRNQSISSTVSSIVVEIRNILDSARSNVSREVNSELLNTYWSIGRIISEHEQTVPERADYGKQTLKELSRTLTKEFGKGFSVSNIYNMRQFYLAYPKFQSLTVKLTWTQ